MVISLGFSDVLSLAQTIAIIATLLITLYFSRKQIRSMSLDVETRVLNDLDEKRYRISELMLEKPEFINVVAGPASGSEPENVIAYMVAMISAHAYHMRERKIISDNEWIGWL
jgi:hypothetical protein